MECAHIHFSSTELWLNGARVLNAQRSCGNFTRRKTMKCLYLKTPDLPWILQPSHPKPCTASQRSRKINNRNQVNTAIIVVLEYHKEGENDGGSGCKECELEPKIQGITKCAKTGKTDFGVEPLGSPPKSPRHLLG